MLFQPKRGQPPVWGAVRQSANEMIVLEEQSTTSALQYSFDFVGLFPAV